MSAPSRTSVEGDVIDFVFPDPDETVLQVRLWQEIGLPGAQTEFRREGGQWRLQLPTPALARLEYLYDIGWRDGGWSMRPDPTNPLRASGPFGDKSWLPLPGYVAPDWIGRPTHPGDLDDFVVDDPVAGEVTGLVWTPRGLPPQYPAGLLLVHDGPEMAQYAGILDFIAAGLLTGELPMMRVALLAPGERNRRYSASPDYADALVNGVLPALQQTVNCHGEVVLAGASLGALAALYAQWRHPGAFGGLFLQSGSFFTPATDPQESGFEFFTEITRFVASVHDTHHVPAAVAVAMTCGSTEENIACNRAMSHRLGRLGLGATLIEHPDMHNWTCWRDTFHPSLTRLLRQVWSDQL